MNQGSDSCGVFKRAACLTAALLVLCLMCATVGAQGPDERLDFDKLELGFDGVYKLGCWTQLKATLTGAEEPLTGVLVVRSLDTDGVPTQIISPPSRPLGVAPGQAGVGRVFFRQGQSEGRIELNFIVDDKSKAKRTFSPAVNPQPDRPHVTYGRPAANEVFLTYGTMSALASALDSEQNEEQVATVVASVSDPDDLPLRWIGYESVDAVVLSTSQPELYRALSAESPRVQALKRWVELGGRLFIYCGANAPELIGPSGPLAELIPGEFNNELVPVSASGLASLENFTGVDRNQTLPRDDGAVTSLQAPKLSNVRGRILAHDGRGEPEEFPLIVRSRLGVGEVTFVALDPNAPPFRDWPAHENFLRKTLDWQPAEDQSNQGGYQQHEDVISQLRSALDTKFVGIKTAPFALVALLVVAYIVWIGPVDYLIVRRIFKRMEATWLTFPLFVLVASAAAYWLAYWMKGDQLRVNQVEIVDVDVATGAARGTVWTHFFSPRVELYDVSLAPQFAVGQQPQQVESVVSWLGVPGMGLGGMQGGAGGGRIGGGGYAFSPDLDRMVGLPVQEWSTKTITARWSGQVESGIEATLSATSEGLLEGQVANQTGLTLEDCLLLHGNWAYRLTTFNDGDVRVIDSTGQPRQVKTALTGVSSGEEFGARTDDYGNVIYDPLGADVTRICNTMMFNEVIGGKNYTGKYHRYQSFVDLSDLLQGDQAILLARAPSGSHWMHGAEELRSKQDRDWIFYRFIIPLETE